LLVDLAEVAGHCAAVLYIGRYSSAVFFSANDVKLAALKYFLIGNERVYIGCHFRTYNNFVVFFSFQKRCG
jgi:hypothetical protein